MEKNYLQLTKMEMLALSLFNNNDPRIIVKFVVS